MKTKIGLALAAATFLSLGASAQGYRYNDHDRDDFARNRFSDNRFDERRFYERGFDAGYRAGLEHRGYRNDWIRGFRRDERRAFDRGYHDGLERARFEQS